MVVVGEEGGDDEEGQGVEEEGEGIDSLGCDGIVY